MTAFSEWPRSLTIKPIVSWPGQMTTKRQVSQFSAGLSSTLSTLETELRHLGGRDGILQVAITADQFRNDGRPRAQAKASHPGIILTFTSREFGALSYPCDRFTTWQDNLRAVALALEALRKVDRYGVTRRGEQYRGFAELEAPRAMPARPFDDGSSAMEWLIEYTDWALDGHAPLRADELVTKRRAVVRAAQRKAHPDHNGDQASFLLVTEAEQFLRRDGLI